ncbi:MAG: guanylate kinase [Xanthomonadales bacterium]|nr:Guanylate kinase [Xanthomonadales bacterium]MCC6592646.1 guanylate kinase [Xanthomonadales bacterium]MCE7931787.1 guanylate kinase [Xanthomonadales bacterium PRO6]
MTTAVGNLFVIAAPSGAGKTSLVRALVDADPLLQLSISHTTRAPRPGEIDGEHYHFTDVPSFERLIASERLLEHALVHGNHYGTGRDQVEMAFAQGRDVILEIDWQGARQIRQRFPDCVTIFILPPSRDSLYERLQKRGQDSAEVIARRIANARGEIEHATEFDYLIVNDRFDAAFADLAAIVRAVRLSMRIQGPRQAGLLQQLLG